MKIGVLCPADIAIRRFMPALKKDTFFEFAGVAVYRPEERFTEEELNIIEIEGIIQKEHNKAQRFVDGYGGRIFDGYEALLKDKDIEAVYIPLPPALHSKWGEIALSSGKHVFLEKPFCTSLKETQRLVYSAKQRQLALHENYMFEYHQQLQQLLEIIRNGEIGDVRLYCLKFGFPYRSADDFRYKKHLGGGALLDAGGYTLKCASLLLGENVKVVSSMLNYIINAEVDIFGAGTLVGTSGVPVQISFGMDNQYKCEMEAWGSKGYLKTDRIFTAPVNFTPKVWIARGDKTEERFLKADDAFFNSIKIFESCIMNTEKRNEQMNAIIRQAELVDEFVKQAKIYNFEGKTVSVW